MRCQKDKKKRESIHIMADAQSHKVCGRSQVFLNLPHVLQLLVNMLNQNYNCSKLTHPASLLKAAITAVIILALAVLCKHNKSA